MYEGPFKSNRFERRFIQAPRIGSACLFFCGLAAVLVFVLPFVVPVPFSPAISASYVAGFNNRIAAISAALISVAVAVWSWRRSKVVLANGEKLPDSFPLSKRVVLMAVLCSWSYTALAAVAIHMSGERYLADAGYFIEQMSKHAEYGGVLYRQLEFAYGPLLFYPTIWFDKALHCGTFAAYFVTLAIEQTIGLVELAFIINLLPITGRFRRLAFILFAFGALNPLLGLNYTLFRYLTPLALLLIIRDERRIILITVALLLGEATSLGISAEMGVAFAASALAMLLTNHGAEWMRWLLPSAGLICGGVFFVASAGRDYFQMLRAFATGGLNLPVAPYPHLLVFLFAVAWLAPFGVGRLVSQSRQARTSVMTCYAFAIALLPSALGRCDPLHVFFVGLVFCVLSFVGLERYSKTQQRLWCACVCTLVLWQVGVNNKLFRFRTADTLGATLPHNVSLALARMFGDDSDFGDHLGSSDKQAYVLDVPQLEKWIGSGRVATPIEIPVDTELVLRRSRHFESSYFAYMVDTFAAPAEQRAINELNASKWAVIPADYGLPFIELPSNLQDLQGFSLSLPSRHPIPFQAGRAMKDNFQTNWLKVDQLGPFLLMRNRHYVQSP